MPSLPYDPYSPPDDLDRGHRFVQVGVTDDAMDIEKCEGCGRTRIGCPSLDDCPATTEGEPS